MTDLRLLWNEEALSKALWMGLCRFYYDICGGFPLKSQSKMKHLDTANVNKHIDINAHIPKEKGHVC